MTELHPGLSGFVCVRNAIKLDYCVELAVQSLLPHCDEVVVCDSDSDDGTREMLEAMAEKDLRIRVINYPFQNPNGQIDWWVKWLNYTRASLRFNRMIELDADEVLEVPKDYVWTEEPLWLPRRNYWKSVRTLIPAGRCCAEWVVRYGPSHYYLPSDEQYGDAPNQLRGSEPEIRLHAKRQNLLVVHHLGFLRKREALFAKVENCLRYWFGSAQDTRLVEAMKHPEQHWTEFCKFDLPLVPYDGPIPEIAVPWLKDRGAL